jgi:hypothetical protein
MLSSEQNTNKENLMRVIRNIAIAILASLLLGAIVFVLAGGLNNNQQAAAATSVTMVTPSPTKSPSPAPKNLLGTWHQTNSGIPGITMTAVVTDGSIKIYEVIDGGQEGYSDVHGLYWSGTFDAFDSTVITSKAYKGDLELSYLGSLDDKKRFTYENGELSFQFSIMKMTTIVQLSK